MLHISQLVKILELDFEVQKSPSVKTACCFSDDHGFSPLHWACREGRSGVVDMLIMRGARINVMNRGDDTPLHLAASHGHRDIVAKVHSLLDTAWLQLDLVHTLLTLNICSVVHFSHLMTCKRQLIQCKADPNTVNEHGNTPLHYACFWAQDQVAEVEFNTLSVTPLLLAQCGLKRPSSGKKQPLQCGFWKAVALQLLLVSLV